MKTKNHNNLGKKLQSFNTTKLKQLSPMQALGNRWIWKKLKGHKTHSIIYGMLLWKLCRWFALWIKCSKSSTTIIKRLHWGLGPRTCVFSHTNNLICYQFQHHLHKLFLISSFLAGIANKQYACWICVSRRTLPNQ